MAFGDLFQFNDVFQSEVASINERRRKTGRADIALEPEAHGDAPLTMSDGTTPLRPTEKTPIIGLSLSGGGIRSAAFCLGVLQALREADVLSRVDYLSTVSGGGYIGSSVSAGMTADQGHFPFRSELSEDETPSLQHIRDYSNYLFPSGAADVLSNASIVLRGLVANAILVLPFLLLGAALTIFSNPVANILGDPDKFGFQVLNIFGFKHFIVSAYFGLFLLAVVIGWGILRSRRYFQDRNDVPSGPTTIVGWIILIFFLAVFCELQPFILDGMFHEDKGGFLATLVAWIKRIALALAPLAAAVAFVAHKVGEVVKSALESEKLGDQIKGYVARAAIYIAAAILPVLLWAIYLQFSYWGICLGYDCNAYLAPDWINNTAYYFPGLLTRRLWGDDTHVIAQLYIVVAAICLFLARFLRPNANSLHPLYRDRLSKAFLFQPQKLVLRDPVTGTQPPLAPLCLKLSELSEEHSPYHLINTALNIQGSKEVNRRDRNADFFIFSRNFVGSKATDYVATRDMEDVMIGLDLGTAVAVSGAAASSNMGAATIKPLTPTLALLNIRLGYWLRNPKRVAKRGSWNRLANFYFLLEMFGLLDETRKSVYLTDGGHIENLGIYELLRRRCKVIIAIDADADPQMAFGSFNVLERYALIDLGVRIDLPWQQISDVTKATGKAIDDTGDCPRLEGPHVAVGEIQYPGGRKGILVYIKSSLTGDENDYVFHYKRRYAAFPHETTLDQLFSEEQFEAYRALGFHAAYRFFDRQDRFAHVDPSKNRCVRDDLNLLDEFFPPKSNIDPCWPRKHTTFADWVPAKRPTEPSKRRNQTP